MQAWNRILSGRQPNLSIEITRECPLACPGCYAYEPAHLGEAGPLKDLADHRGEDLVQRMMDLVAEHRPVHLSIVGGEPLVRYRELNVLLPRLSKMGVAVQVVTSAVRPIPAAWRDIENLFVVVSIDGLQPEHDRRRAPATYERILSHIRGQAITVHCTVTRQLAENPGGLQEFLSFWSGREDVRVIWLSFFTPQVGAQDEEIVPLAVKEKLFHELSELRLLYPSCSCRIASWMGSAGRLPLLRSASSRAPQPASPRTCRPRSHPASWAAIPIAPSAAAWPVQV